MIKVTGSSVTDGEVELIVTACRFFLDRLLPAAQPKNLTLNIDVTDRPGRTPIAIKWLVGSSGFLVEAAAPFCDDGIGCGWGQRWVGSGRQ